MQLLITRLDSQVLENTVTEEKFARDRGFLVQVILDRFRILLRICRHEAEIDQIGFDARPADAGA